MRVVYIEDPAADSRTLLEPPRPASAFSPIRHHRYTSNSDGRMKDPAQTLGPQRRSASSGTASETRNSVPPSVTDPAERTDSHEDTALIVEPDANGDARKMQSKNTIGKRELGRLNSTLKMTDPLASRSKRRRQEDNGSSEAAKDTPPNSKKHRTLEEETAHMTSAEVREKKEGDKNIVNELTIAIERWNQAISDGDKNFNDKMKTLEEEMEEALREAERQIREKWKTKMDQTKKHWTEGKTYLENVNTTAIMERNEHQSRIDGMEKIEKKKRFNELSKAKKNEEEAKAKIEEEKRKLEKASREKEANINAMSLELNQLGMELGFTDAPPPATIHDTPDGSGEDEQRASSVARERQVPVMAESNGANEAPRDEPSHQPAGDGAAKATGGAPNEVAEPK